MDAETAAQLLALNRNFYTQFGASFSATRHRLQPGVQQILSRLHGNETILDLGCGNGELARVLARRGHQGAYLGLDFSLPLLQEAQPQPDSIRFVEADLTQLAAILPQLPREGPWQLITAFAVLHHIPSTELRLDLLRAVRTLMAVNGRFILSNWQFLKSESLRARIQPWEAAALSSSAVDPEDYLLDWRSDGYGLRYVHHFSEEELTVLAQQSGFVVEQTFYADGRSGNLSLYQIWVPNSP